MKNHRHRVQMIGLGILAACLLIAALPYSAVAESPDDIVVFVNPSSRVAEMTKAELRQLFLKQKTTWSSGEAVVCINAPSSSELRKQFRSIVMEMSETEEATHWANARIRSQVSPPAEMVNTPKAVFRLKNAVSYAFRKNVPPGVVKIVLVLSK